MSHRLTGGATGARWNRCERSASRITPSRRSGLLSITAHAAPGLSICLTPNWIALSLSEFTHAPHTGWTRNEHAVGARMRYYDRSSERAGTMGSAEAGSYRVLLRRHRLAAGLTQEELAERAGLSVRGVQDLERGLRRTPHADYQPTPSRSAAARGRRACCAPGGRPRGRISARMGDNCTCAAAPPGITGAANTARRA